MRNINFLVVHHLGNNPRKSGLGMWQITLRMIRAWHYSRFAVNEIQYHYVIFPNGKIENTRKDKKIGWHCANNNTNALGIALVGDFTQERPTGDHLWSLRRLLLELSIKYELGEVNIVKHKDLSHHTLCPGNIDSEFEDVKKSVVDDLKQYNNPPIPVKLSWWQKLTSSVKSFF